MFGPVVESGIHNRLKICRPIGLASSSLAGATKRAGIAQSIEHFTCNEGVAGLSPAAGSKILRTGSSVVEQGAFNPCVLGSIPSQSPTIYLYREFKRV